ncbi:MAG: signal peptide peptidase SppA [Acidobacteriota bacterium]|nr:signal peptide peptidase SppA [Acidobacteriota bacterium]
MKHIGKIILVLIALFVVVPVLAILGIIYSHRVKPNTVLVVRIEGEIPERSAQDSLQDLFTGPPTSVTDITEGIERARTDPHITGLELLVGETNLSMGSLQEIRDRIQAFNNAHKFSVGYLEFATNRSYYLASACHTLIMLPKSEFHLHGMMASTTFMRGTFDKLGIFPDFLHIGDYKNATNVYTEKKFTAAHREATKALVDDWYRQFIQGVAASRGLKTDEVEKIIAAGPYNSDSAPATHLVDRVAYANDARGFVEQENHGHDRRIGLHRYLDKSETFTVDKIAVIYAVGEIVPGTSGNSPWGGEMMGSETIARQFRRASDDDSVKAVVVRVDSPGGVAFSSEVIRHELERTRAAKPVVVSMGDVAASGGYWLAMSANRIIAEPGTVTGSIGVLMGKFNLQGLYEKLGLSTDFVATTENSTLEYPLQNFTPAQREIVLRNMRATYDDFIHGVAAGRHMKVEDVDRIAQGRVWTGERARELGLVDELGGLHTAIARARELARIPASEKVSVLSLPAHRSFIERLLNSSDDDDAFASTPSLRVWLGKLQSLSTYSAWTILPGIPEVQ